MLAVLGPGLVAASSGNDAGSIATYASAGASYGYSLLWLVAPSTAFVIVVQLLAARVGRVTGKGLVALIRETAGRRSALAVAGSVLAGGMALTVSEFVGIGSALGIAGIPVAVSVPLAGFALWLVIVTRSDESAERILLLMTFAFFSYPVAALLAHPDWSSVARAAVTPHLRLSSRFLFLALATAGTALAPYMPIYLQSELAARSDRRRGNAGVVPGSVFANLVAAFVIVATGATLFARAHSTLRSPPEAARALEPLAGDAAAALFAIGLIGASLLAAAVLPMVGGQVLAELVGGERTVRSVVTSMLLAGVVIALVPGLPVVDLLVGVQVLNGALLPAVLVSLWRAAAALPGHEERSVVARTLEAAAVAGSSLFSLIALAVSVAGLVRL